MANSVDPNEMAPDETSHLDLHCFCISIRVGPQAEKVNQIGHIGRISYFYQGDNFL